MPYEDLSLKGRLALITGASRGIGRGIAIRLAERGASVAVNYLQNQVAAQSTVDEIKSRGGAAFAMQSNVARPDELAAIVRSAHERLGGLDIFVHNALGDLLGFMSPPLQVTPVQWKAAMEGRNGMPAASVPCRSADPSALVAGQRPHRGP